MEKKESKSGIIRFIILIVLAVLVVGALYIRLTNQTPNSTQKADEDMNEIQILKLYDLEKQYPKTARDVAKLHCRFLKTIYNEELEKEEMQELNTQIRKLFSEELLNANPEEEQFEALMADVNKFHADGRVYISYEADAEDKVVYNSADGDDYAMFYVTYKTRENNKIQTIQEQYLLVKENEVWKIQGWQVVLSDETAAGASETENGTE